MDGYTSEVLGTRTMPDGTYQELRLKQYCGCHQQPPSV